MRTRVILAAIILAIPMWCSVVFSEETIADATGAGTDPFESGQLVADFKGAEYFFKQREIADKLVALGDKDIIPEIAELLESEKRSERCNAGYLLAKLGDERGLPAIIAELEDTGPRPVIDQHMGLKRTIRQDRYYAVHVLGALGDARAVPVLLKYLDDDHLYYKVSTTLGEIGDKRAIGPLRAVLRHDDAQHRFWATYGLAILGEEDGVTGLIGFLRDSDFRLRRHAAGGVAAYGGKRALPVLVKALDDENVHVRRSVITALGNLGDPRAIPHLRRFLDDQTPITRGDPTTISHFAQQAIENIVSKKSE
jgi:HEAT repeat protein